MINNNEQIIQANRPKILAVRNYKSDKEKFVVDDFLVLENLENILVEVANGESDITPAGKSFLEKYYGFENLANILLTRGKLPEYTEFSADKLRSWLENLEPMETITFIEESRGNIVKGQPLKEDLLPPKDI